MSSLSLVKKLTDVGGDDFMNVLLKDELVVVAGGGRCTIYDKSGSVLVSWEMAYEREDSPVGCSKACTSHNRVNGGYGHSFSYDGGERIWCPD